MPLETDVNIRTVSVLALSAATHLAFGATPETPGSPTELHPVTVEAPKTTPVVRFDIRAACPSIDSELQKTLSSAWGWVQKTGTYPLQLRVEGNRPRFRDAFLCRYAAVGGGTLACANDSFRGLLISWPANH